MAVEMKEDLHQCLHLPQKKICSSQHQFSINASDLVKAIAPVAVACLKSKCIYKTNEGTGCNYIPPAIANCWLLTTTQQ